ncbi:hypothetical protein CEXT_799411 [Caerostris extrusa]|uniref:Uncharacterized protein n=1 Tax=Caerostris extrusa TaxID=172846 RepID=A0AAV4XQ17_CAEEX|nr:hypothetical protein CEXT_799411 [Caerostris extrusa]
MSIQEIILFPAVWFLSLDSSKSFHPLILIRYSKPPNLINSFTSHPGTTKFMFPCIIAQWKSSISVKVTDAKKLDALKILSNTDITSVSLETFHITLSTPIKVFGELYGQLTRVTNVWYVNVWHLSQCIY